MENDLVNSPRHYAGKDWEAIEILEALGLGPQMHIGCVLAYLVRYERKGGRQDIEKALWYLKRVMSSRRLSLALADIMPELTFSPRMANAEDNFGITDVNILGAIYAVMSTCLDRNGVNHLSSAIEYLERFLAPVEVAS